MTLSASWWPAGLPGGLDPVAQDPDDVRLTACELLSPNIRCSTPEPPPPRNPPTPPALGGLLQLLMWLALAAAIVFVIVVIVRAVLARRPRDETPDADDDGDLEVLGDVIVDRSREPFSWRDEADRHAAEGRVRDALRCRYRALVGDLARRGLLDEIPGRTTGEERGQLELSAPSVADHFAEAADLFDGAWYGDLPVDASDLQRFVALENEVLDRSSAPVGRRPLIGSGR